MNEKEEGRGNETREFLFCPAGSFVFRREIVTSVSRSVGNPTRDDY